MSSISLLRLARQSHNSALIRSAVGTRRVPIHFGATPGRIVGGSFSTTAKRRADKDDGAVADHHEESFEEFTARYEKEFEQVNDVFELQRNLNNAFAYDLVPSPSVITAALKAARRVNDFPTAVRIFEGIKAKVENKHQYEEYLEDLKPIREELGVSLQEDLYPGVRFR